MKWAKHILLIYKSHNWKLGSTLESVFAAPSNGCFSHVQNPKRRLPTFVFAASQGSLQEACDASGVVQLDFLLQARVAHHLPLLKMLSTTSKELPQKVNKPKNRLRLCKPFRFLVRFIALKGEAIQSDAKGEGV